jgi:hypothetical protein
MAVTLKVHCNEDDALLFGASLLPLPVKVEFAEMLTLNSVRIS